MKIRLALCSPSHPSFPNPILFKLPLLAMLLLASLPLARAQLYWDSNDSTPGFGTAQGTWAAPTTNNSTQGWSTSSAGIEILSGTTNTTTSDNLNFGTAVDVLAVGTITVSGTVNANSLTFGSASGSLALTGGTISLGGSSPTIAVNNTSDTISSVLAGSAGLTKTGTGTLTLTGVNTYNGTTTINSGTLQIGNGTAGSINNTSAIVNNGSLVINKNENLTLAPMTGTGNLTADLSTGFLRLGGDITLDGTVTINNTKGQTGGQAGIRQSQNTTIRASAITLNGSLGSAGNDSFFVLTLDTSSTNGTISLDIYNGMGGHTWAGASGVVANAGTGALNIVGAQAGKGGVGTWNANLTGALNIASTYTAGTLTLNATAASSVTGSVTLATNSTNTWTVSPGVTMNASGVLAGSNASITKNGTGRLTISGNSTYNGTTTINDGTLQLGAGGTAGTVGGNITNNAALVVDRSNNFTFGNTISGTGCLTKNGNGTLTLSAENSYSGGTTINAGLVNIGNANALGTSGNITFGGGGIQYGSGITQDLSSRVKNSGSAVLIDTNGNNVAFGSALDSTNSGGLTKNGNGTLALAVNSTYTGVTTINAGTLEIAGSGQLNRGNYTANIVNAGTFLYSGTDSQTLSGNISGSGGLTKDNTSTLTLSGNNTFTGPVVINAGTLVTGATGLLANTANVTINSGGNYTVGAADTINSISGSGDLRLNAQLSIGTSTFGGNISGASAIATGGTLTFSGNNSNWTGGIAVTNGAVFIAGADNAFGNGTLAGGNNFGAAIRSSDATDRTLANSISRNNGGGGTLVFGSAGTGNLTIQGGYSSTNNYAISGIQVDNTWTQINGAVASLSNRFSLDALVKTGNGTLILNGNNTYTPDTTINSGTLQIGGSGRLGAGNYSSNIAINGVTSRFLYSGTNNQILSGAISGNGALTHNGSGILTLSANNTYTGATLVTAGSLIVNGSLAAGSALTVESGATLGGNGTINGAATVNGNLAPGNSPGVLKFANNLTLGSTASVAMELNGTTRGTGYDGVDVTGALTYSGTLNINIGSQFLTSEQTFSLFTFGSQSGDLAAVNLAGAYGSGVFSGTDGIWTFTDSSNNQWTFSEATGNLGVAAIPEPSTWALLALSLGAGLLAYRRRKV